MNVLVMESDHGAGERAAAELRAAGMQVLRCHDRGGPPFPCRGMVSEGCPLDETFVDVALVVRRRAWPRLTLSEIGTVCAIRAGIPLVVSGNVSTQPFEAWTAETVPETDDDDVVSACRRAAEVAWADPERLATEVFREVLVSRGIDPGPAHTTIARIGDRLHVRLRTPLELPAEILAMAATRVGVVVSRPIAGHTGYDITVAPAIEGEDGPTRHDEPVLSEEQS